MQDLNIPFSDENALDCHGLRLRNDVIATASLRSGKQSRAIKMTRKEYVPCRELSLSPRGRWWKPLCISLVGHSCIAMILFYEFQVGHEHSFGEFPPVVEIHFQEPSIPSFSEPKFSARPRKSRGNKRLAQHQRDDSSLEESSSDDSPIAYQPIPQSSNIPPEYPEEAQRLGIQGTVRLKLMINGQGMVVDHEILEPRSSNILEIAAIQSTRKWRFKPHPLGKTVEFLVPPIEFKFLD